MIEIFIPDNNIPERKYALHVLLNEYLGLEYTLHVLGTQSDYTLKINGRTLRINDAFFGEYPEDRSYLSIDHLPLDSSQCSASGLEGVQLLFGEDELVHYSKSDEGDPTIEVDRINETAQTDKIYCGVDIIAASFFMLTRWEEYVIKDRDEHGRFPSSSSLAGKSGFVRRPVVNEYVALLKKLLIESGVEEGRFKKHAYRFTLTVDVDFPRHWKPGVHVLKKLFGTALRTGSIRATQDKLASFREFQRSGVDTYDSFDFLMDCAETNGQKAYFFFMSGGSHNLDSGDTLAKPETLAIAMRIKERGHECGIHPSYSSHSDADIFYEEVEEYSMLMGERPQFGRQHYLRFEVPRTWRLWEEVGALWESSMSYSDEIGFRCGTCHAFPVFDVVERRMLSLVEKPLIVMDVALRHHLGLTPDEAIEACAQVRAEVEKYDGDFVVLWHNSSFGEEEWPDWNRVLEALCQQQENF